MNYILGVLCLLAMAGCASKSTSETARDERADKYDYSESSENSDSNLPAGNITAAELNDLQNWKEWKKLKREFDIETFPEISKRISVRVLSKNRKPLSNMDVTVSSNTRQTLWKSRTDNHGNAELFVGNQFNEKDLTLQIENTEYNTVKFAEDGENLIISNSSVNESDKVEIAFVVDATGSMGDELEFLKAEVQDVVNRAEKNLDMEVFTSAVFYRDQGDDYVTRVQDFSDNVEETRNFISKQYADGGGDFPEAVDEALSKTIYELQWSKNSYARLVFLILDAPPHEDQQTLSEIKNLIQKSSEKGIKLIPVVASGIDKDTEFLMRQFAISTNGTYVFITDDSGIGNTHLEPTSKEDYQVQTLNDLMVELIVRYCSKPKA